MRKQPLPVTNWIPCFQQIRSTLNLLPMCTTGRKDEQFSPTFQVVVGPPAQLARLAGELVLNVLIVLAGGADPAAAHLALPDHLHATQPGRQRWWGEGRRHLRVCSKCWSNQNKTNGPQNHLNNGLVSRGISKAFVGFFSLPRVSEAPFFFKRYVLKAFCWEGSCDMESRVISGAGNKADRGRMWGAGKEDAASLRVSAWRTARLKNNWFQRMQIRAVCRLS